MMKITLIALVAVAFVCAQETQQPEVATDAPAPPPVAAAAPPAPAAAPADAAPAASGPAPAVASGPAVTIVKQSEEVDVNKYSFEYETSDGTSRQEQGEYKNDTEQEGLVVRGSYSYTAPDGQHIAVTYLADKNGYQPSEEGAEPKAAPSEQNADVTAQPQA